MDLICWFDVFCSFSNCPDVPSPVSGFALRSHIACTKLKKDSLSGKIIAVVWAPIIGFLISNPFIFRMGDVRAGLKPGNALVQTLHPPSHEELLRNVWSFLSMIPTWGLIILAFFHFYIYMRLRSWIPQNSLKPLSLWADDAITVKRSLSPWKWNRPTSDIIAVPPAEKHQSSQWGLTLLHYWSATVISPQRPSVTDIWCICAQVWTFWLVSTISKA